LKRRRACLSSRVLSQVLRGRVSEAQRPSVETHLALCAECRGILEVAAEAMTLNVGVADLRDRIARASGFAAEIEQQPSLHVIHALIYGSDQGRDPFVAGCLLTRSREEFAREPRKSLTLARSAAWVAERAAADEIQFHIWLDCSSIFVRLGEFDEALEALDRAGALVSRTSAAKHSTALLLYAKAYVASQPDVWKIDEALAWTDAATRIFAHSDAGRLRAADDMRAYLHYCRGEHAAAVEICRKLWNERREVGLALNLASYLVEYGDPDAADDLLTWARPRIDVRDTVTIARHGGIEGRVRAAQENWDVACEVLARSVEVFRGLGMEDTAIREEFRRIRCAVSAAPDSIASNAKALHDLQLVVSASIELDRREPTRRRRFTVEALEYLRELGQISALTVEAFRHVEEYLDSIARGPARPFVRPVPVRVM
jgi:tetratricopeptide (TPR) repeat protein